MQICAEHLTITTKYPYLGTELEMFDMGHTHF